jgi:GNAT superfamily N-acetyltransferase
MAIDKIAQTLLGDTKYYAIGNTVEQKYGATLISNTNMKVWSCNMARDFQPNADLSGIIKHFQNLGIDFCRAFVESDNAKLIEQMSLSGFRAASSQIGFWIDRYDPFYSNDFSFEEVKSLEQRTAYMELHRLEAEEHGTPSEIVNSIGLQRLDKNRFEGMKWFLVYKYGTLAGSVGILILDKSARIKNPYTLPEFRGQGIGANACHYVNKLAFDKGSQGISVYAQPGSGGFKLYTKMGFAQVLEHKILMRP